MIHAVANRLPLAEAALRILRSVCSHAVLDQVWEQNRGSCYTRKIDFPQLFHLVREALMEPGGSGHRSFERAIEDGRLKASLSAPYKKLNRLPLPVSCGLVTAGALRVQELGPEVDSPLPSELSGLTVINLDGKKTKHVFKRLKVARGLSGDLYGAKLLVAQHVASDTAIAMTADPDGERSDAPLLLGLLEQVRAQTSGPRLFVADRQFGDTTAPWRLSEGGDFFLLRRNRKTSFHPDPDTPGKTGTTKDGQTYVEQWGWLGAESNPKRLWVRQIHLKCPDGSDDVLLITDLWDAETYPAEALLDTYRLRWRIETLFQVATEVFGLNPLIGSSPEATAFQAALCLTLFNLVQLIQAHVAAAQSRPRGSLSTRNLYVDLQEEWIAWCKVLSLEETETVLGPEQPPEELKSRLRALLKIPWTDWWIKRSGGKNSAPRETTRIPGGHTSVYRLMTDTVHSHPKNPRSKEPKKQQPKTNQHV